MRKSLQTCPAWLWLMVLLWMPSVAWAQSFTQGNLVVLRVGDGTAPLSNAATAVNLIEYSPSGGSPISTLAMPTTVSGNNARLTQSGTAGSEGGLTRSADKRFLTLVGYDAAVGTASITGTSSATTNRVVARVDNAKNVNSSTRLTAYSANNIRSAVTNDGNQFWTAGPSTGITYASLGSTGAFTTINGLNSRIITIFNGQLYVSSSSGTNQSVSSVGTGLPTTAGQTVTLLPGLPATATANGVYGYTFFDRDPTVAGVDLLYVADQSTTSAGGILKYSFDGTTWTARGSVTGAATGLTGAVNGTGVDLYVTVGTSAGNTIYKVTDAASYSETITGSGTAITAAGTLLATAPANTAFRGIAFAPVADAVTNPTLTVNPASLTLGTTTQGTPTAPQTYTVTAANLTAAIDINAPTGVEISTALAGPYGSVLALPASTTAVTIYARLTGASIGAVNGSITNASGSSVSASVGVNGTVTAGTPPTIVVAGSTTAYLNASAVSGVMNNVTDPASTFGIDFTVADSDTDINSLLVTATSSNPAVVPNASLNLTGSGASRNLKITPTGVGYATITVTVSDGSNTASYPISYAASAASTPTSRFHTGSSDASTAQAVGTDFMLVGDDENQALRLYKRDQSGLPVKSFDFTASLGLTDISGGVPREIDIEGSVQVGNRIYWIGSHSNKSDNGNSRPNRSRLFATDITGSDASATLTYVGRYDNLKSDMVSWDQSNGHGLGANYLGLAASTTPGKAGEGIDGFNIEGLTVSPDNSTAYVAFRAPIEPVSNRTKALIVPVTNVASLVSGNPTTGPATFGAPILLDLGGRGIREIKKNSNDEYVLVAGSFGSFGAAPNDFRLYTWTGNPADAPVLRDADLSSLAGDDSSIESIVALPSPLTPTSSIQFMMDNGDRIYYGDGVIAKDLPQNNFKKSRSDYATLGAAIGLPTLAASPTSLTSFTASQGTASASQSYVLTATNLPASLTVLAPVGVAVSSDNSTFTSSLVLPQATTSATVYARLTGAVTGAVSGTITNVSGTLSADVAISGTVNTTITATLTGSATVCAGNPTALSVAISGGTGPYTVVYSDGVDAVSVANYTPGSAITVTPSSTTSYTLISVTDAGGNTASARSGVAIVTVNTSPNLTSFVASGTLTCAQTRVNLIATATGENLTYAFAGPNLNVVSASNQAAVSTPGTYTVTVSNGTSCPVVSQTVAVASEATTPTATLVTSGTLTCETTNITLTATGGQTYAFSGPGLTQTGSANTAVVTQAGLYSVTVTSGSSCSATASVTVVTSQSPPALSINPSSTTLSSASPTTSLTATSTNTGTFLWSNGETTPVISVSASGTYSVTLTTPGGCTATASASVELMVGADLTPSLSLPEGNFAPSGPESIHNLTMNLYEVGGKPTSGMIVLTLTAPLGYSISFDPTLTSINVTGGTTNPVAVNNATWEVRASSPLQLTLASKTGQSIGANGLSVIGLTLTRSSAASVGSANLTVNVNDDASKIYDSNSANNIFVRILNSL